MMKEARSLTDNKKRMELLFKAGEKLLMEEMPILPLYYRNAQLLVKPDVRALSRLILDIRYLNMLISSRHGERVRQ